MVQGIVGEETDEKGRKVYVLQCQGCAEFERLWPLVLMTFKFCTRYDKDRGRDRLCPTCRRESLIRQGYSERQALGIVTDGYLR